MALNFFCRLHLYQQLDINSSYYPMQFKEKLLNQTLKNNKKPNFGPDFGMFRPKFVPNFYFNGIQYINCCNLSLYGISRKTNDPNLRKQRKNLVSGPILAHLPQSQASNFFFEKSGSVSHQISWSAIIMYNIRKN